jgi:hypothetical protein
MSAAAAHMTRLGETFEPIPANRDLYAKLYSEVYAKSYERLRPLYHAIQKVTGYPKL